MARERGEGSIYRPKGSNVYHVKFYKNGRPIRETTSSTELNEAKKVLRQRLAEVRTDTFVFAGPPGGSRRRHDPTGTGQHQER